MNVKQVIQKAGGSGSVARKLGVSQARVSNWCARGRVPVEFVLQVESLLDGAVTRHDLRPDIFGARPQE